MKAYTNWVCTICGEIFRTRRDLQKHRKQAHEGELGKPNHYCEVECRFCGKKTTTKEGNTKHEKYCEKNPNKVKYKGHPCGEAQKRIISASMKQQYAEGKRYSGWNKRHNKVPSYAELWLMGVIENEINDKDYKFDTTRIRNYTLDFSWDKRLLCIEMDGEQHYTNIKRIESDKRKDALLKENGWKLLRLRWSWVMKHKEECVILVRSFIDSV
jgi:very-short-patch-repair endonuclease